MSYRERFNGVLRNALDKYFIKKPALRLWITHLIYGQEDRFIHLMGAKLKVNATNENGYLRAERAARNSSVWRDEVVSLLALAHIVEPGDTFIDAGANIGLFSCVMSRFPGVRVVAFEANENTFQRLSVNTAAHGADARQMALSDKSEVLEFYSGAVSHVFAAAAHRNAYHLKQSVKVQAQPLDEMPIGDGPFVIKVDVEGHELSVLQGASRLIEAGKVKAVLLDASPETRNAAKWLQSNGFRLFDPVTFAETTANTGSILAMGGGIAAKGMCP